VRRAPYTRPHDTWPSTVEDQIPDMVIESSFFMDAEHTRNLAAASGAS